MKCKSCGGACVPAGDGTFVCECCGKVYRKEDFAPKPAPAAKPAPTPVRAAQPAPLQPAPAVPAAAEGDSGADVFEQNKYGTLELSCRGKRGAWSGSGYVITGSGYAVTNAHVAADEDGSPCKSITAHICGQDIAASVVALADDRAGSGTGADLAVIKLAFLPYSAKKLTFEPFSNVKTGEQVFVIGNSLGDGTCITSGIVSDRRRSVNGKTLLMTDCAINGGNSGGPIFNKKGRVIGTICSSRVQRDGSATEGMNYAVPSDTVLEFVRRVLPEF